MKRLSIILIALTVLFTACNPETNPMNGVSMVVDTRVANSSVSLMFADAATGQPINDDITVSISGDGVDNVFDIGGYKSATYKAKNGFLTLAIISADEISETNKINFVIEGDIAGFLPSTHVFSFTEESHEAIKVSMLNIAEPESLPDGVEVTVQTAEVVGGVVQDTLRYNLISESSNTGMDITIPAGMVMKDASGVALSGDISVSTVYFNNQDDAALAAYPGGLNMKLNSDNRAITTGFMTTCGFTRIHITDELGRVARNFTEGTMYIEVEIPTNTIRPNGDLVVSGDNLKSISRQEDEDAWFDEDDNIPVEGPNDNGNLVVASEISHLSYHNWGWFTENTCESEVTTMTINSEVYGPNIEGDVNYEIRKAVDNKLMERGIWHFNYGIPFDINVYEGQEVKIILKKGSSAGCISVLDSAVVADMCTEDISISIPVETDILPEVKIIMDGTCSGAEDVVIKPSLGFWYLNTSNDCADWQQAYMVNGEVTLINLEVGATYQVNAYIDEQVKSSTVTVTSDSTEYYRHIDLPTDVCNMIGY